MTRGDRGRPMPQAPGVAAAPRRAPGADAGLGRRGALAALAGAAAAMAAPALRAAEGEAGLRARLAAARPGETVELAGRVELARPLRLAAGVRLAGRGAAAALVAGREMAALVEIGPEAPGAAVAGLELDGAGRAQNLVAALGARGLALEGLVCVNWRGGLLLGARGASAVGDLRLARLRLERPAAAAVFPILVRSGTAGPPVTGFVAEDIAILGSGGAYTPANRATADQLTLQGVEDFRLAGIVSRGGGENGITVSRLSRRGVIEDCEVTANDGHGLNIGSGFVVAEVDDAAGFAEGDRIEGPGRIEAELQRLRGRSLYLNRLVRGRLAPGDLLAGPGGQARVTAVARTGEIRVRGVVARGNWVNVAGVSGAGAGLYVQQADQVFFEACRSGDDGPPRQPWGLLYAQSDVGWRDCDLGGNAEGEVRAAGASRRLPFPGG